MLPINEGPLPNLPYLDVIMGNVDVLRNEQTGFGQVYPLADVVEPDPTQPNGFRTRKATYADHGRLLLKR